MTADLYMFLQTAKFYVAEPTTHGKCSFSHISRSRFSLFLRNGHNLPLGVPVTGWMRFQGFTVTEIVCRCH